MGIEKATAGPLEMFGASASLLTQSSTEHHRLLELVPGSHAVAWADRCHLFPISLPERQAPDRI